MYLESSARRRGLNNQKKKRETLTELLLLYIYFFTCKEKEEKKVIQVRARKFLAPKILTFRRRRTTASRRPQIEKYPAALQQQQQTAERRVFTRRHLSFTVSGGVGGPFLPVSPIPVHPFKKKWWPQGRPTCETSHVVGSTILKIKKKIECWLWWKKGEGGRTRFSLQIKEKKKLFWKFLSRLGRLIACAPVRLPKLFFDPPIPLLFCSILGKSMLLDFTARRINPKWPPPCRRDGRTHRRQSSRLAYCVSLE